jgi:hypothetical protein
MLKTNFYLVLLIAACYQLQNVNANLVESGAPPETPLNQKDTDILKQLSPEALQLLNTKACTQACPPSTGETPVTQAKKAQGAGDVAGKYNKKKIYKKKKTRYRMALLLN